MDWRIVMSDLRKPLKEGSVIIDRNNDYGIIRYYIRNEIGRGSSCIVYNGYYIDNTGAEKTIRIKEYYPYYLNIERTDSNLLSPDAESSDAFSEGKEKFKNAYIINTEFSEEEGITNSVTTNLNIHEYNNTLYSVTTYSSGSVLSKNDNLSIKEKVEIVKALAVLLKKIHDKGYLYLDLKPDNIFIYPETKNIIQLFDFDSPVLKRDLYNKGIHNIRLSYTKGYAAIELRKGQIEKITERTDIYGLGAVLFSILFHYEPNTLDCVDYAQYDYPSVIEEIDSYERKLFYKLTDFFHKSLAPYYKDRYENMDQVIQTLSEICSLTDKNRLFIHSYQLDKKPFLIGREKEYTQLYDWSKDDAAKCIVISGMEGIGRSTLCRELVYQDINNYDSVSWLMFSGDIKETIISDNLRINTIKREERETKDEYYKRKIRILNNICSIGRHLLILDNFDEMPDEDFRTLLNIGWKVVIVSRNNRLKEYFDYIEIQALGKEEDYIRLFETYLHRKLLIDEVDYINTLVNLVQGHTLALELIARQIQKSRLTLDEALQLIRVNGFSRMSDAKVSLSKDQSYYHDTILTLLSNVYSSDKVEDGQDVLITIALFGGSGIDLSFYQDVSGVSDINKINILEDYGWIHIQNKKIWMHPVIREAILSWDWDKSILHSVMNVIWKLYKTIQFESEREEIPKGLRAILRNIKNPTNVFEKHAVDYINSLGKHGGNTLGQLLNKVEEPPLKNRDVISLYLRYASNYLKNCKKIGYNGPAYLNLLYTVVIHTPIESEQFPLHHIRNLINSKLFEEYAVEIDAIIRLYELLVEVLLVHKKYDQAWEELKNAEQYVKKNKSNYIQGIYHDMCAGYYDMKLGGLYDDRNNPNRACLIAELNKAISYMKKAPLYSRQHYLLPQYMLSKTIVLIRSEPENRKEIRKLLNQVELSLDTSNDDYSEVRFDYYMTLGWYHTYVEKDYRNVRYYLMKASNIISQTTLSVLTFIDQYCVPAANMLAELNDIEGAENILQAARHCFEEYTVLPVVYQQKDDEIKKYLDYIQSRRGEIGRN